MIINQKFWGITVCLKILFFHVTYSQDTISESDYDQSQTHYNSALDLVDAQRYEEAIGFFSKSIQLNDGNADAYAGRANAQLKLLKLTEALSDVSVALELTTGQSDIYYLTANILFRQKKYKEAIVYYDSTLVYNSTSKVPVSISNSYYNRGIACLSLGKHQEAVDNFTSTIELNKDFKNAYHNRGIAYRHLYNKAAACQDFAKAELLGSTKSKKFLTQYCR